MKRISLRKTKVSNDRLENIKKTSTRRFSLRRIGKFRLSKRVKKVLLIFLGVFLVTGVIGTIAFLSYLQKLDEKLPTPDSVFAELPVASEIFDRLAIDGGTGTRLWRMFNEANSDDFDITEVPDFVKLAFLAGEDEDFYLHSGFDLKGILFCGFEYIKKSGVSCGGSTITQQLAKLRGVGNQQSLERKIEELLLSIKIEQKYNKDEILNMYLRAASYGSSIVGLKTASIFYFGKEPKNLTLAEAVALASVVNDPSYTSPTVPISNDVEAARAKLKLRMDFVFGQLEENMDKFNTDLVDYYNDDSKVETLTFDAIEAAKLENWEANLKAPRVDIKAGHFVNWVVELLQQKGYNNGEPFTLQELQTGGYKIYTTLDYGLQQTAEFYVRKGGADNQWRNSYNSASMTTVPATGQVITWVGSKDFFGGREQCGDDGTCKFDGEVDILRSLQEPGSTNKPLGYYEAFNEAKVFPGSLLPDIQLTFKDPNGSTYDPRNWDNGFNGIAYSTRQALRDSRNIPAIQIVSMIGVEKYLSVAKDFGYSSYTGSYGQSIILGGGSVYPYEHAQGYGVFSNGGDLVYLNPILKIVDKKGNTVYEATPEKKAGVGNPQAIYLLNQTIFNYDNYSWDGRELAGKTGTTENNIDAWYMGYTPDMVTVCWNGNNNNNPMAADAYPINIVHPWCKDMMRDIGNSSYFAAKTPFARPGNIVFGGGDCNSNNECLGLNSDWLIADRIPARDIIRKSVQVCSDQRDKLARDIDRQLGFAVNYDVTVYKTSIPEVQKQLDAYMTSSGNINYIPTEFCNIDRSNGTVGPFFSMTAPTNGTIISGGNLNIRGGVFVNGSTITSLTFSIDGVTIPCTTTNYNSFDITCSGVDGLVPGNGTYTFSASATDALGRTNNSGPISVTVGSTTNTSISVSISGGPTCNGSCNRTITVDTGSLNIGSPVTLYVVKNGVSTSLGEITGVGTIFTLPGWSSGPNPGVGVTDTYTFFVDARIGNSGTTRSPSTPTLTVNGN